MNIHNLSIKTTYICCIIGPIITFKKYSYLMLEIKLNDLSYFADAESPAPMRPKTWVKRQRSLGILRTRNLVRKLSDSKTELSENR